jgi:hypothetical protein
LAVRNGTSTYATLRNTNNGFNGYVKDLAHEALDDAGHRRLNGVAAQSMLTALLVMAANVRKIRTFSDTAAVRRKASDHSRHRPDDDTAVRWRPGGHGR